MDSCGGSVKKCSLSTLQAKADSAMSLYIRMKHADEHGYCKCVSCKRVFRWQEMDAGHFVPKSRGAAVRWIEENVWPECRGCNRFSHDHLIGYTLHMIDYYGKEKIEELKREARRVLKPAEKRQLAEEAYAYYTQALKDL